MMVVSKLAILIIVLLILLSVFVAKITNLIEVKDSQEKSGKTVSNEKGHYWTSSVIGNEFEHLMWFVQISDLHLSIFHDPKRIEDFRDFCNKTVEAIAPSVVLVTGDLTDAKNKDNSQAKQYRDEWIHYNSILSQTNVNDKTLWLDVRGNHDNFNVPRIQKKSTLFHEYSTQGKRHNRSYMYTITKSSQKNNLNPSIKYSFIGIDAALDPGPKAPWNFIGKITESELSTLMQFEKDSQGSNATIWFGHYPTSCIISPKPGIREVMKSGTAYLCGHLHTVYGLIPKMYTLQHSGLLELEVADFKDNRMYRVAAFDHGIFSFMDVPHAKWPVILLTNPKNTFLSKPSKDETEKVLQSTHIRLLVFSLSHISNVRIKLDDEEEWILCSNVKGPLYIAKWNPSKYSNGTHKIKVYAKDKSGKESEFQQEFSLDRKVPEFNLLSRIALMVDADPICYGILGGVTMLVTIPLAFMRVIHCLLIGKKIEPLNMRNACEFHLIRKLWLLSSINKLMIPMFVCPIYLVIGPWYIGEMIDGYLGIAFAWGTYIDGSFLPAAFSYNFAGSTQVIWFQTPFLLVLCHCVDLKFKMMNQNHSQLWKSNIPLAILLLVQFSSAWIAFIMFKSTILFLGPLQYWSCGFAFCVFYLFTTLRKEDFKGVEKVLEKDVVIYDAVISYAGLMEHDHIHES